MTHTERGQSTSSFTQQPGPTQVPANKDYSASPVQKGETATDEERAGSSSKSVQHSEWIPATSDQNNKDYVGAERATEGMKERGMTETPETGARLKDDERSIQVSLKISSSCIALTIFVIFMCGS